MSMTFEQFQDKLQRALGNRGLQNLMLEDWINLAYLDLIGAVKFEILTTLTTTVTVASQDYIDVPDGAMVVELVKDTENGNVLGRIPHVEYYRRAATPTGIPKRWSWVRDMIKLTPVPSGIFDMLIITRNPPEPLQALEDVTVLPSIWDQAIFLLSAHNALLDLKQEARSAVFLARAISYIQSRMTESDLEALPGLEAMQEKLAQIQASNA